MESTLLLFLTLSTALATAAALLSRRGSPRFAQVCSVAAMVGTAVIGLVGLYATMTGQELLRDVIRGWIVSERSAEPLRIGVAVKPTVPLLIVAFAVWGIGVAAAKEDLRIRVGITLGILGSLVIFVAGSFWTALLGLAFLVFAQNLTEIEEAMRSQARGERAARWLIENMAFLSVVAWAALSVHGRFGLREQDRAVWPAWSDSQDVFGALLVMGVFFLSRPFPIMRSVLEASRGQWWQDFWLRQAVYVMALLWVVSQHQMAFSPDAVAILEILIGVLGLFSVWTAWFQTHAFVRLQALVPVAMALALVAEVSAGMRSGVWVGFGLLLGLLGLAALVDSEAEEPETGKPSGTHRTALIFVTLQALLLPGMAGSSFWLQLLSDTPVARTGGMVLYLLVWFFWSATLATHARSRWSRPLRTPVRPWLWVLLALGFLFGSSPLWIRQGLPGGWSTMLVSAADFSVWGANPEKMLSGLAVTTAGFLLGLFWTAEARASIRDGKLAAVLREGFYLHRLWEAPYMATVAAWRRHERTERDRKANTGWRALPAGLVRGTYRYSLRSAEFLERATWNSGSAVFRKLVTVPGKTFQLLQSGDLQWYLVLALLGTVALIVLSWRTWS